MEGQEGHVISMDKGSKGIAMEVTMEGALGRLITHKTSTGGSTARGLARMQKAWYKKRKC